MPFAAVNGVELYHEVHGSGAPLVLVHEFAGSAESWAPQVDALGRGHRLVLYNCRGYPPSTVPADPAQFSQDIAIEDLRALLDHLKIERATLCGLSMGGGVALNFTIRHPARVAALVLAGTGSGSVDKAAFATTFLAVADCIERDGLRAVADDYLMGPTRIQLRRKDERAWRKLHREFSVLSPAGLASTIRRVIVPRPTVYELEPHLKRIAAPVLVIVGQEDTHALEPSRFLAATIPDAELAVFPGTGHTVNLEEPRLFNDTVLRFLDRVSARPA